MKELQECQALREYRWSASQLNAYTPWHTAILTTAYQKKFIFINFFQLTQKIFPGVVTIQNTPTSSRSLSQDDVILSASSFGADRTSVAGKNIDKSTKDFVSTKPVHQLESSRSLETLDKEDIDTTNQLTSPDGNFDPVITASKHIEHIEGNNIEVKPAEYYE